MKLAGVLPLKVLPLAEQAGVAIKFSTVMLVSWCVALKEGRGGFCGWNLYWKRGLRLFFLRDR